MTSYVIRRAARAVERKGGAPSRRDDATRRCDETMLMPITNHNTETTTMENFPQELFVNNVMPFVGNDQFLFVAGVNRSFYAAYVAAFPDKRTAFNVTTRELANVCFSRLSDQKIPKKEDFLIRLKSDDLLSGIDALQKKLFHLAAKNGYLDTVQFLREEGCPGFEELCTIAALHGQFHVLLWARNHSCPWDENTCANAASIGNLDMLKWVRGNGCPWNRETCNKAAENGHLTVIEWAVGNGCPVDASVFLGAARFGHLRIVKWAHWYGLPWHVDLCSFAAFYGHLDILQWVHSHGCHSNTAVCCCAASTGQLHVLQWAHNNWFFWDEATCMAAAFQGKGLSMHLDESYLVFESKPNDSLTKYLDVLQYARENGCPWHVRTCTSAAYTDNVPLLQYAHENGCPWDQETCNVAARQGNLSALMYAHEHGCPWGAMTCLNAALHGLPPDITSIANALKTNKPVLLQKFRDCVVYAHEHGCPWDISTCAHAAAVGDLELLQYAHENGCPWDVKTTNNAALCGHLDVMRYAHENGCPFDEWAFASARDKGHLNILQYLFDHQLPGIGALETLNKSFDDLVLLHTVGAYYIECPKLGTLDESYDISKVSITHPVESYIIICEGHVLRVFNFRKLALEAIK